VRRLQDFRIMNLNELIKLPSAKLKRIVALRSKIEQLESQLAALVGGTVSRPAGAVARKRRKLSAAARKRISLAAKARWAKFRSAKGK